MNHPDNERFLELAPYLERVKARLDLPLLVLVRWSHAVGAKDYLRFQDFESFQQFCAAVPTSTNILAFTGLAEPVLGVCGSDLVSRALDSAPASRREWLILNSDEAPNWSPYERSLHPGSSPLEIRQTLRALIPTYMACQHEHELKEAASDLAGNQVTIYPHVPSWNSDPFLEVIIDGTPGTY